MRPDLTKLLHSARHVGIATAVVILWTCDPDQVRPVRDDTGEARVSHAWLERPEQLEPTDHCARALRAQLRDLGAETLSVKFGFERYPVSSTTRIRKATYLDFTDSSALVIMDSKKAILRALGQMAGPEEACAHAGPRRHTDLRPWYFQWKNHRLEQLAPAAVAPPPNTFWKNYFGS